MCIEILEKLSKVKLKESVILEVEQFSQNYLEKVVHSARQKWNMKTVFMVQKQNL